MTNLKRKITILLLLLFAVTSYGQVNPVSPKDSNVKEAPALPPIPPTPLLLNKDTSVNVFDSLHGKLNIFVKNINKIAGNLHVALFNSYMSFMNNGPVFKGVILPVTAYSMMVTFDSIPKGIYSVAVFHDEDKNGILTTNPMNIPIEGYGFSNNAIGNLGPPTYNQTKFFYSGKNKTIVINMIYFKFPK